MATKITRRDKKAYVDWLKIAPEIAAKSLSSVPVPDCANSFYGNIWPAANEYFSVLNPIFLVQCLRLDLLNVRPRWLIRDGSTPLAQFFHRNLTLSCFAVTQSVYQHQQLIQRWVGERSLRHVLVQRSIAVSAH